MNAFIDWRTRALLALGCLLIGGMVKLPAEVPTNLTTRSIAAGEKHSLAVRSDGSVWAWGTNTYGQLGVPTSTTVSPFPVRVDSFTNAVQVAAGQSHSLVLLANGTVWAFGLNSKGQLGNNSTNNSPVPVQVAGLTNVASIAAGDLFSLAVKSNGTIFGWGQNYIGQLGNGTSVDKLTPVQVLYITNAVGVAGGSYHSLAACADGKLWAWGHNAYGALGFYVSNCYYPWPQQIAGISGVKAVAAGQTHSLVAQANGTVWACGVGNYGQLGNGQAATNILGFTPIAGLSNVAALDAHFMSSMAVRTDGALAWWGWNGAPPDYRHTTPHWEEDLPPIQWVARGNEHNLAVAYDGSVFAWEWNREGEMGEGTFSSDVLDQRPRYVFGPVPKGQSRRLSRGILTTPTLTSFVIPLSGQEGVRLDATGNDSYVYGQSTPWYQRVQKPARQHVLGYGAASGQPPLRFPVENPIAGFGGDLGGSPLYPNQVYSFGVYAGGLDERTNTATNIFRLLVYARSHFLAGTNNVAPVDTITFSLPRRSVDSVGWASLATNGFVQSWTNYGLKTDLEYVENPNDKPWGLAWFTNVQGGPLAPPNFSLCAFKLSHRAEAQATNYHFIVEGRGSIQNGTNATDIVSFTVDANNQPANTPLYALDFAGRPSLRPPFIDQWHFAGEPLPPEYAGKTLAELAGLKAVITNAIWVTNRAIDTSPELRSHPVLEQLVSDLRGDPLALSSFVLNEIELTDPIGTTGNTLADNQALNPGGVNRSALGTLLERQGSPLEQCALLVYLLRKAGYSAAYVFPTTNNLKLLDRRVSQLLRMQVKEAPSGWGPALLSASLVTVNYPWVVVNLDPNRSVQIFPWLKDTEIVEGLNLYDYVPANYVNGHLWARDYSLGNPNLLGLAGENSPLAIYPKFLAAVLATNAPGISLEDLGVRITNRRHHYARWEDLPLPNALANQAQVSVVDSLSASTNTFPFLHQIFNTFQAQVFKGVTTNGAVVFDTGELRMADLNNRKFLLFSNQPTTLRLWLAPARPENTNVSNFAGADQLTNKQALTYTFGAGETNFTVRLTHKRHRAAQAGWWGLLNSGETLVSSTARPYVRGDCSALILNVGRVTSPMLALHAADYWRLEQQRANNPTYAPPPEDYQGTAAYLLGLGYCEREDRFNTWCERLHKVTTASRYVHGLARISSRMLGGQPKSQGGVDMVGGPMVIGANRSLRPDVGEVRRSLADDLYWLELASLSANEHTIINSTFGLTNSISTVRLLQLAQARTNGTTAGVIELNSKTYLALGNSTNAGYTTKKLKDQDTNLWNEVVAAFANYDGEFTKVFITPGPIQNEDGAYKGMGALIWSPGAQSALISSNQVIYNGGAGGFIQSFDLNAPSPNLKYTLVMTPDGSYTLVATDSGTTDQATYTVLSVTRHDPGAGDSAYNPSVVAATDGAQTVLYLPTDSSVAQVERAVVDRGYFGGDGSQKSFWGKVADPVNTLTGEFYVDAVDLSLPGPLPLQLRRNYLSQNQANTLLGYGWKLNLMPYLVAATNNGTNLWIAADADGSVFTFRSNAVDLWTVQVQDNPSLNNHSVQGIGGPANWLNARIEHYTTNGTVDAYRLRCPDGGVRIFEEREFPVSGNGVTLYRQRPYLKLWQDNRGNSFAFSYGTNATANDYGQLVRIESGNGGYLGFSYDGFARITEASAGDGRRVSYEYDKYGDLVGVILPDQSVVQYEYQHAAFGTNNALIDSQHLLTREVKPDGRVLKNEYDTQRRVTNQYATVGPDLGLVRNATFIYTNNFSLASPPGTLLTGSTTVRDVFNNDTTYGYTNSLIAKIADPVNPPIEQYWYPDDATPPGYRRSLWAVKDQRGLWTTNQYDINGNLTNVIRCGNLTGAGLSNERAITSFAYDTNNNLPTLSIDAAGNTTKFFYTNTWLLARTEFWPASGQAADAITNLYAYANATSSVTNGGTNVYVFNAYGLRQWEIRAAGTLEAASNRWDYDGRGFVTRATRYPGTGDANVTVDYVYNDRGLLAEQTDAAGRKISFAYDPLNRPQQREVYEANAAAPLAWEYSYYNENGELVWSDGPRYNPEDYVWRDYDGAGRKSQEIHWRSRGRADGSGVEAETGEDLFATTFYFWDAFGNLTNVVDPRGNYVNRKYDPIGQLVREEFYEAGGALLGHRSFAYGPGGQVAFETNALGAVSSTLYTSTGQPYRRVNFDGSTNGWTYYLDGRVKQEFLSNGNCWTNSYQDALRRVTRTFMSGATALAVTVQERDRRGNVVKTVDGEGFAFTNLFDGLDRIKLSARPAIPFGSTNAPASPGGGVGTNQERTVYFYAASGQALWLTNALGHLTATTNDALGRPLSVRILGTNGAAVRVTDTVYSPDHHSATVWSGTGTNSVATTLYTDNDGQSVLTIAYPHDAQADYTWQAFDRAGNRIVRQERSLSRAGVNVWATNGWTYDGLNRVKTAAERDGATVTFSYNALGNVTNRALPGNTAWSATYTSDGRILSEETKGGSDTANALAYAYYGLNQSTPAKLQSVTDGRNTTRTFTYDAWLRLASVTSASTNGPEQQQFTGYAYDNRGLLTNLVHRFATNSTGPDTALTRSFDANGHLIGETVWVDGEVFSTTDQSWDEAGRRTMLASSSGPYSYGFEHAFDYRADGLLSQVNDSFFTYADNGLLQSRSNVFRSVSTARDGRGRAVSLATRAGSATPTESLAWRGDNRLTGYTALRGDFTDSRAFGYTDYSRYLKEESFNVAAGQPWVQRYTYAGGLGVLTGSTCETNATTLSAWAVPSGGLDGLSRVTSATNNAVRRTATGRAKGAWTVSASVNGRAALATYSPFDTNGFWRAEMELLPGTNTLQVSATHPSGQFTTNASRGFFLTNTATDTAYSTYDGNGNVTRRVWRASDGATNRTQVLAWDSANRLVQVVERDLHTNGFNWSALYDGLGRRLRTLSIPVTNSTLKTEFATQVDCVFDPEVKFLEIGVNVNGEQHWLTYGPDVDGRYGSMQGMGGLEIITSVWGVSMGLVGDHFGNIVARREPGQTNVAWHPLRLTSYGPAPGYAAQPLGPGTPVWLPYGYRGMRVDETGLYCRGARYYDPVERRFISSDPLANLQIYGPYTAWLGDPNTYWDPLGLCNNPIQPQDFSGVNWQNTGKYTGPVLLEGSGSEQPVRYVSNASPAPYTYDALRIGSPSTGSPILDHQLASFNSDAILSAPGTELAVAAVGKTALSWLGKLFHSGDNLATEGAVAAEGTATQLEFDFVKNLPQKPAINWPANWGFAGDPAPATLVPGTLVDRLGYPGGTFVSPEGTPFIQRSLAPGTEYAPYNVYQVLKPIDVNAGPIAPAFGMPGNGMQFQLPSSVQSLIDSGHLGIH